MPCPLEYIDVQLILFKFVLYISAALNYSILGWVLPTLFFLKITIVTIDFIKNKISIYLHGKSNLTRLS